ncbi:MAG TPA: hypothetical protein PLT09_10370 [Deltaproteobacteria bacterium]|nr:hypothetical protein [Deltaproteobacteria bacterium]HPR55943.1 hypothetical protein [Deltaproteobacteria bacterium]HXK47839.1 hypothetical protein [Deltaproteobacteria bacterium]
MKTNRVIVLVLLLVLAATTLALAADESKEGTSRDQDQGWTCPWCGRDWDDMGPGMMYGRRGGGYGWGPGGMMGPGYGYRGWRGTAGPVDKDQAKLLMERYIASTGNPNLKLGKIMDKDTYYEAEIVTKNGSLVDKLMVDKQTGWIRSVY